MTSKFDCFGLGFFAGFFAGVFKVGVVPGCPNPGSMYIVLHGHASYIIFSSFKVLPSLVISSCPVLAQFHIITHWRLRNY